MRLSSTLLALAAAITLASSGTAKAASAEGTATATIIAPIAITAGDAMSFGSIAPGTADSTVDSTDGSVVGTAFQADAASAQDQTFSVTGASGETYSFADSEDSVTLNGPGGNTLTAALTYTSANPAGGETGTLNLGTDTLTASGVLTVPSTAVAGSYTGNYQVAVNYN
jgi:hypothetical protein